VLFKQIYDLYVLCDSFFEAVYNFIYISVSPLSADFEVDGELFPFEIYLVLFD
jgi:hypothetical protein